MSKKPVFIALVIISASLLLGSFVWWIYASKLLSDSILAAERAGLPTTPDQLSKLFAPPESGQESAELLQRASEFHERWLKESKKKSSSLISKSQSPTWVPTNEELAELRDGASYVARLQSVENLVPKRDWNQGITMSFPEFSGIRYAVQCTCALAVVESKEGRFEQALDLVHQSIKAAQLIGNEPILIGLLTRTVEMHVLNTLNEVAAICPTGIEVRGCIRKIVDSLRPVPPPSFFLMSELMSGHAEYRNRKPPTRLVKAMSHQVPSILAMCFYIPAFRMQSLARFTIDTLELYEQAKAIESDPVQWENYLYSEHQNLLKSKASLKWSPRKKILFYVINSLRSHNVLVTVRQLFQSCQTGEMPIDPFSGKPLLENEIEGGRVIYSVGINKTDDGGFRPNLPRAVRQADISLFIPEPIID